VSDGAPDPLTLRVACVAGAAAAERELFEDAGEGFGPDRRRLVRCEAGDGALTVRLGAATGGYAPPRERVELELRGLPGARGVTVDGAPHAGWRREGDAVVVVLDEGPDARTVLVER
jgi:hypothetical protein